MSAPQFPSGMTPKEYIESLARRNGVGNGQAAMPPVNQLLQQVNQGFPGQDSRMQQQISGVQPNNSFHNQVPNSPSINIPGSSEFTVPPVGPGITGMQQPQGFPNQLPGIQQPQGFPNQLPGMQQPQGFPNQLPGMQQPQGFPNQLPGIQQPQGFSGVSDQFSSDLYQYNPPSATPPNFNQPLQYNPPSATLPNFNQPPQYNPPSATPPNFNQPPQYNPSPVLNQFEEERIAPTPLVAKEHATLICPKNVAIQIKQQKKDDQIKMKFGLSKLNYNSSTGQFIISGKRAAEAKRELENFIKAISSQEEVKWAWLGDKGDFIPYDQDSCSTMEQAYQSGQKECFININGNKYRIEFNDPPPHRQVLPGSKITRTVRRLTQEEEEKINLIQPGDVIWYWKDDDRKFKPYTAEGSRQIEEGFQSGVPKVLVQGDNIKAYLIDFGNRKDDMCQFNEVTQYRRPIKRGSPD